MHATSYFCALTFSRYIYFQWLSGFSVGFRYHFDERWWQNKTNKEKCLSNPLWKVGLHVISTSNGFSINTCFGTLMLRESSLLKDCDASPCTGPLCCSPHHSVLHPNLYILPQSHHWYSSDRSLNERMNVVISEIMGKTSHMHLCAPTNKIHINYCATNAADIPSLPDFDSGSLMPMSQIKYPWF